MDTIIFDLDGTLLPMDLERFMKDYLHALGTYFSDMIDYNKLIKYVLSSTNTMLNNEGSRTNEEVFMDDFEKKISGDLKVYQERFDVFYDTHFHKLKECTSQNEVIIKAVSCLKEKNYNLVVATNPLFPLKAVLNRIEWAGLNKEDFTYISCYEKHCYCKPNPAFFSEVLHSIGKEAKECIMVGNDTEEDLAAKKLGIKTYLITDHLIHKGEAFDTDYQGTYEEFYEFVLSLPSL